MSVVVVTVAGGRRRHLERQAAAVAAMSPAPARHIVVALDAEPPRGLGRRVEVVHRPVDPSGPLPVGAARNLALDAAGADLAICLDVDCLPAPGLLLPVQRAHAVTKGEALLTWPVGRLAPLEDGCELPNAADLAGARDAARRQGRPTPAPGALRTDVAPEQFWSLAFAVSAATHGRIGRFDPGFAGYGAEDTDYALRAAAAGVPIAWVGGAWAYHQHHPVSDPPVEHLADIVRNARRFHRRWGRWPMERWLAAFAERELIRWTPGGGDLVQLSARDA